MAAKPSNGRRAAASSAQSPSYLEWSKKFLEKLAETSNVTASANHAGIDKSKAYDTRRKRPDFHRLWNQALCEGYELLELELLQRLRTGEIKRAPGSKIGARTFDNATALRLLGAHKDTVGRQRAIRSHADAEALIQGINQKLETIRQRRLAAEQVIDG